MIAGIFRVLGGLGIALGMIAGVALAMVVLLYAVGYLCRLWPLTGRHKNKALERRPDESKVRQ